MLTLALVAAGDATNEGPPTVHAQARSTTSYVGQSIDVFVSVVAGREAPRVVVPKIEGATITHVGTVVKPLSMSAIGAQLFEQSLYRARYRVVARRAGTLVVPPFSVLMGVRRGFSAPLRLTIKKPPEAGRTAEFLGGVGAFEVEAEAVPDSVRLGQDFEYRIIVNGPAARGTAARPDVDGLERMPMRFHVERRPDVAVDDPPSHTFVYRLRATVAGAATLPPLRVAAFDPATSSYQTKVTEGVRVRVTDVTRFDPSALDYGSPNEADRGRVSWSPARRSRFVTLGLTTAWVSGCVVVFLIVEWRRNRASRRARRLCRAAASRLARARTDEERGRAITEGLTAHLGSVLNRPAGALTPVDAHQGILQATGSGDLARRAARLIARCDAARFGGGASAGDLLADGRRFFLELKGMAGSNVGKHDERQSTA